MKIAIPLADEKMSLHFGHCEAFAMIEVDDDTKVIKGKTILVPPPHEPGLLPKWLAEHEATIIIAGGMGARAQQLFAEKNIKVVLGATETDPEKVVQDYLNDTLKTGENPCDH
jgi:predicted Fe-Mo cluster-binding NifX family protein